MRMNAAPSGMFEVSGPRPSPSSSRFSGVSAPNSDWLVGEVVELRHAVVLEVVADREVDAHVDPHRREMVGGPDPGEHQQHRRLVGAGREDHLALGADLDELVAARDLDADGPVALEQDPRAQRPA